MKVRMRLRLPPHRQAEPAVRCHVVRGLYRVSCHEFSLAVLEFSHLYCGGIIEAWVNDRIDEATLGREKIGQGEKKRPDIGDVEKRHIAERRIEITITERD